MQGVRKPETTKHLGKLFNTVAASPDFQEKAKSSLVYRNLYDSISKQNPADVSPEEIEVTEKIFSLFHTEFKVENLS